MAESARNRKSFAWYLGRWAWVFLLSEVILLVFSPVFFLNKTFHTQLIATVAAILIGTLTAFFTRRLMPKAPLFLRIFFPLSSLLVCLVAINWITAGQAGFGSLHDPLYGSPWWGMFSLVLGITAIVLTLLAWPRRRRRRNPRPSSPRTRRVEPSAGNSRHSSEPSSASNTTFPILVANSAPAARTNSRRESIATASLPANRAASLRVPRRRSGNNHLRFSDVEEHRCPYCLEVVEPNDPRGVVICDICHAYHHKDCWDVTGRCQVPHQAAA